MSFDVDTFNAEIPAEILAILSDAEAPHSQPEQSEAAIRAAVAMAPDNLALRCAAYTFYFYANRMRDAMLHAEACLEMAARALGAPSDWRLVDRDCADFGGLERPQRIYLKSLLALGYCRARTGDREGGEALLRKAASLDPQDRIGAAALADLLARGSAPDDDDDDDEV